MDRNENFLDPVYQFFNKKIEEARDFYRKKNSTLEGGRKSAPRMTQFYKNSPENKDILPYRSPENKKQ